MSTPYGLGRRAAPDPRDHRFLIQRPSVPSTVTAKTWNSPGQVLDQGDSSMCVAYSGTRWLTAAPVTNKSPWPYPSDLYLEAQRNDEWEGEDYDGTSVRALFKVFKNKGLVSEFRWAFDCETIVAHLL